MKFSWFFLSDFQSLTLLLQKIEWGSLEIHSMEQNKKKYTKQNKCMTIENWTHIWPKYWTVIKQTFSGCVFSLFSNIFCSTLDTFYGLCFQGVNFHFIVFYWHSTLTFAASKQTRKRKKSLYVSFNPDLYGQKERLDW